MCIGVRFDGVVFFSMFLLASKSMQKVLRNVQMLLGLMRWVFFSYVFTGKQMYAEGLFRNVH